jgi:hypothetical protein
MANEAKRLLDVEDVVRWACADDLPKKRPASEPQRPRLGDLVGRADRLLVGRATRPAGFPRISPMFTKGFAQGSSRAVGGEPHPDALVIEAAIAKVAAAGLGQFAAGELEAAIAPDIGVPVDAAGAIAAARANTANLVLVHGRLGSRPGGAEAFAVRPRLAANGKPGVWRIERLMVPGLEEARDYETPVKPIRKDVYPPGSYCRIEFEPNPQLVVNDRADYLAWRLALDALAEALSGKLQTITALAPAAALLPWTGEADGYRPSDLFGAGAERIYALAEAHELERQRSVGAATPPGPPGPPATRDGARPSRPGATGLGEKRRPARRGLFAADKAVAMQRFSVEEFKGLVERTAAAQVSTDRRNLRRLPRAKERPSKGGRGAGIRFPHTEVRILPSQQASACHAPDGYHCVPLDFGCLRSVSASCRSFRLAASSAAIHVSIPACFNGSRCDRL